MPALNIFESSLRRGKFDANRKLSNGALMEFAKIYPMDAVFDTPEDVPEDVRGPCSSVSTTIEEQTEALLSGKALALAYCALVQILWKDVK